MADGLEVTSGNCLSDELFAQVISIIPESCRLFSTSPPGPCALEKPACPRFLRRRLFLTVVSAGRMGRRRVPAAVTGMGGATRVPSPEPAGARVSGAFRAPGDK